MAETEQKQTIGQWLESLAKETASSEQDSAKMANLLRRVGFPKAVVTCGIVYLEGRGTIDAPPVDVHSVARMLVER